MSLKENLKRLRMISGLTLEDVAVRLGISKPTLQRYESGVISNIPSDKIEKLAEIYKTTPSYLMGWTADAPDTETVRIPIVGKVAAGLPIEAYEYIQGYEEISRATAEEGVFFALRISGHSMEPKISQGDIVIVRKQNTIESGKIGIVMVDGQDATCKKVILHENGLSLVPLNPAYPVLFFSNDEVLAKPVTIIGVVTELRAKL